MSSGLSSRGHIGRYTLSTMGYKGSDSRGAGVVIGFLSLLNSVGLQGNLAGLQPGKGKGIGKVIVLDKDTHRGIYLKKDCYRRSSGAILPVWLQVFIRGLAVQPYGGYCLSKN